MLNFLFDRKRHKSKQTRKVTKKLFISKYHDETKQKD